MDSDEIYITPAVGILNGNTFVMLTYEDVRSMLPKDWKNKLKAYPSYTGDVELLKRIDVSCESTELTESIEWDLEGATGYIIFPLDTPDEFIEYYAKLLKYLITEVSDE